MLTSRIEAVAAELLVRARHEPHQSMQVLARRLEVPVVERELGDGLAGCVLRRSHSVLIAPSGYAARDEFTLAHELMELHLPAPMRELPDALREQLCDRGAAALLLPRTAFRTSADKLEHDLPALRRAWPTASWATLARRMVDVGCATTASGWDSLELAWRHGGEAHPDEEAALAEVYTGRGRGRVRRARAWRLCGTGLGRAVAMVG